MFDAVGIDIAPPRSRAGKPRDRSASSTSNRVVRLSTCLQELKITGNIIWEALCARFAVCFT